MIADIPQSPDSVYTDIRGSNYFHWRAGRNYNSFQNLTNGNNYTANKRSYVRRQRRGYSDNIELPNQEGLDVFLKFKVRIYLFHWSYYCIVELFHHPYWLQSIYSYFDASMILFIWIFLIASIIISIKIIYAWPKKGVLN